MESMSQPARLLMAALVSLAPALDIARADDRPSTPPPERIERMSDEEVSKRLDFLVGRLDEGRDYAWWWWNGWTAFYGLGVVIQGTRAGLETEHDARRAEYVISAVKATGGVITLLMRPLEAKDGADPVRAVADEPRDLSPSELRKRQLAVAESLLEDNAEVSLRRYNWLRHVLNVAVNAAGAIIIWKAYDDPSRAARSGGIGTAVGEVAFWTQPWWPADDWEEYQRRFDDKTESRVSWRVGPTVGGAAFQITF
jgi:hypothetical protein